VDPTATATILSAYPTPTTIMPAGVLLMNTIVMGAGASGTRGMEYASWIPYKMITYKTY